MALHNDIQTIIMNSLTNHHNEFFDDQFTFYDDFDMIKNYRVKAG